MKIYRESLKNIVTASMIGVLFIAFCSYFHKEIGKIISVSWYLTVGENQSVATPEDRLKYLQSHPGEIKLAMIGDWENGIRSRRPRQKVLSLAITKINQAGGISGRKIITEWMDFRQSSDKLHEFVEKVAHDPSYYAVIGPSTSGQLLSIKPLLLAYKLLTFAPAISNTNATQPDDPPYIFLPNSSDAQDVDALCRWAQEGKFDKFILINENQPFSAGYAQHVERIFFENGLMVSARTFFNPTDNISYFMNELKNYAAFFKIQHALIINYSIVPETYERMAKWMLANTKGNVFSYKMLPGDFSEEEMKRMFSAVYFKKDETMKFSVSELATIPGALQDSFAPAAYQTPFLLADACRKAKSMHQQDVIKVLQNEELKGPYNSFRFNDNRFEKDPVIRIVSIYQLRRDWGEALMKGHQAHPADGKKDTPAPKGKKNGRK